ncbi:serine/threonine-protein kinase SIK2-like isoform X3 [Acinonyx jubatus]|uniref:non-specific serine/threonine protein kinase n=1 Tax=Acinonyx jubatus TaxID=32536 RepID=A0ABM3PT45_ACIJB|nr:serine/threonine-protein kinase SIK2-like isoform X3 [Acinonyx jubatus]
MLQGRKAITAGEEDTCIYEIPKTTSEGSIPTMKLAPHILTGKQSDVKFIRKTQKDPAGLQGLCREAQNMKTSSHPSIVVSLEVINTKEALVLLSEYVSRDNLCDEFTHRGQGTEEVPDKFCRLLSVVEYCHQQGMIGRYRKLETLLFEKKLKTENMWYTLTTIQPMISTPNRVYCWGSVPTCSSTGLSSERSSLTSEGTSIGTTITGPRCNSPATNSNTSSECRQPGRMSLEPKNQVLKALDKFKNLFKKTNKIEP